MKSLQTPQRGLARWYKMSTHSPFEYSFENIVEANEVIEEWLKENREDLSPSADASLSPIGIGGVSIKWYALSDEQRESLLSTVEKYLDSLATPDIDLPNKTLHPTDDQL